MRVSILTLMAAASLVVLTPLVGALAAAPSAGDAAIVFAPGHDRAKTLRAIARADSRIVRFGSLDNIAIVRLEAGSARRLRAAGALFVLDPQILGGCLAGSPMTGTFVS